MELVYWPSEARWGLPSIDIESLHVLAYIKFTDAKVVLAPTFKSWLQQKGRHLPCLHLPDDEIITSTEKIILYMKHKYYNADTWLSDSNKINTVPLVSLIEDTLFPAVIATLWLDSGNYTEVTRGAFAKNCRYPLNFTAPKRIHDKLEHFISISKTIEDQQNMMKKLIAEASSTLTLFSEYLNEKDFIFGDRPSSLDALLFSCLAPLLKMPLMGNALQNHLRKSTNLCQYVNRILIKFFKDVNKLDGKSAIEEKEEEQGQYDWIFPVCVATVAMVSYAANAGLLEASK